MWCAQTSESTVWAPSLHTTASNLFFVLVQPRFGFSQEEQPREGTVCVRKMLVAPNETWLVAEVV